MYMCKIAIHVLCYVNESGTFYSDDHLLIFLNCTQLFEEPGEDSSRFDTVVPTIVRPPPSSSHLFDSGEPIELGILRQFTFSSELQVHYIICPILHMYTCTLYMCMYVYMYNRHLHMSNNNYCVLCAAAQCCHSIHDMVW